MFLLLNLKSYKEATGKRAYNIAKAAKKAKEKSNERIAVAPQTVDIGRVANTDIEVFSQHLDPVEPGSHIGVTLAEGVKESGASGTILNHSEYRLGPEELKKSLKRAESVGLETVVCASDAEQAEAVSSLNPDYVAVEPPELIGSGTPVSKAEPYIVEESVKRSEVPVLCGAGITERDDVEAALELGAEGVLVASAVTKAEDPEESILELVGLK